MKYSAKITWKALVGKYKKNILNSKYGDIRSKVFIRISCQLLKNKQRIRIENGKLCFLRGATGYRMASSESNKDIRDKLETIVDFNGAIKGVADYMSEILGNE
jgi:hypothetical protein